MFFAQISPDGIIKRDEKVFAFARDKGSPILMLTSGYMLSLNIVSVVLPPEDVFFS